MRIGEQSATDGLTLIEVITVIWIIAILSTIAVPAIGKYIQTVKERVCYINCCKLEDHFEAFIVLVATGDCSNDDLFNEFLRDYGNICPSGGIIRYIDGKVECSVHNKAKAMKMMVIKKSLLHFYESKF